MALLELCSLDDVLRYPNNMGTVPDSERDWVLMMIRSFSQRAEKMTGREFHTETRTHTFSPHEHQQYIQLPAFGASGNTVTSVHEDTDRVFGASQLVSSSDYYFDWRTGLLHRDVVSWQHGFNVVQVIWSGGLGTTDEDVPEDLRVSCVLQVVFWYQHRAELGIKSRGSRDGSVTIFTNEPLLPEVEQTIQSYAVEGRGAI